MFKRFYSLIIGVSDNAAFIAWLSTQNHIDANYLILAHVIIGIIKSFALKNANTLPIFVRVKQISFIHLKENNRTALIVAGHVYNHPTIEDGEAIVTDPIISYKDGYFISNTSQYKLIDSKLTIPDPDSEYWMGYIQLDSTVKGQFNHG